MGQTFSVTNANELSAAIDAANGGDRIELSAGDYGELNLSNTKFGGAGVTIASADPDNMALFDKITLYRVENVHIDRVEIDFEPVGNSGYKVGFRAAEGKDISITNSVLHGGFDASRAGEYAEAPVGLGVQIQRVDNVVIENNEIYDFHAGISVAYIDGLSVGNNYVHDMRTSPMAGGGVSNVEVFGNHFSSSHPIALGGTGDHGDMIHLYPLTNQNGPMENIVIRDNFLEQGSGDDAILGIYIDDAGGGGSGIGYRNVIIENNIVHNGDAQGLRVENVDGLRIVDNSFLQSSGVGLGQAPGIVLTSGTQNVVIDNNILAGLISGSSIGTGPVAAAFNVNTGDNIYVQDRDPFGENYVGDLFVNGLTPDGNPQDFTPLNGSVVEGYGSSLTGFNPGPGEYVAVIDDTRGDGLDLKTINFDVEALYDANGAVNLAGASVVWNFGDGTTATGDNINHTYDGYGSYDVTATLTLGSGRTVSVGKTVDVFTPDVVDIDFEGGITDDTDRQNRITLEGEVRTEQGRFGDALRLVDNTSRVEVRRTEEILDNPEFSISFAFQKDGGTANNSDNGMFTYYSGTSYISTGDGTLSFVGTTSTGRVIRLDTEDSSIEDGAWHHVTYTFSAEDRMAVLYLDGEEVDRMENLTGIQHTTTGHDLHLGGRVGGAFGGLLDEYQFTRAALTADEVESRYEDLFGLSPEVNTPPAPEPQPEPEEEPEVVVEPVPQPEPEEEPEVVVEPVPQPEPEVVDPRPEPQPVEPEVEVTDSVEDDAPDVDQPFFSLFRNFFQDRDFRNTEGNEGADVGSGGLSSGDRSAFLRFARDVGADGARSRGDQHDELAAAPAQEFEDGNNTSVSLFDFLRDTDTVEEALPAPVGRSEIELTDDEFGFLF